MTKKSKTPPKPATATPPKPATATPPKPATATPPKPATATPTPAYTIPFAIDLPETKVASLLCTAFEGGYAKWAQIVAYREPTERRATMGTDRPKNKQNFYPYIDYPLTGGAVILRDKYADDERDDIARDALGDPAYDDAYDDTDDDADDDADDEPSPETPQTIRDAWYAKRTERLAKEPGAYVLDAEAIIRGLKIMADKFPQHFGDFLAENDDAITGDVFLQCCVLGDVVYG